MDGNAIPALIGFQFAFNAVKDERRLVDPVGIAAQDASEETLRVRRFESSKVSRTYDHILKISFPVRHKQTDYSGSIISD
jgi:hypothetical protein